MFSLKIEDGLELRLPEERHAEAVFAVVDLVIYGMLASEWSNAKRERD